MANLVIKEEEVKQLDTILGEVPMKYGMPLVNFLNAVAQKRAQEAQFEQQKAEEAANQEDEKAVETLLKSTPKSVMPEANYPVAAE